MGNGSLIGYFVDKAGNVTFPVIGDVMLSGLTLEEAENRLKQLLSPLLKDPIIRVRILNYRFTFTGQINTVVTAPVPRISLIEALSMAGGFDELSDRENIKILRQREDKMDVLYVNLLQEEFISSPNFWLQQGDIIIVPPLKQRTARQYLTQNIGLVVSLITLVVSSVNLINR
jgi:polysaccharide export outer membrane protein